MIEKAMQKFKFLGDDGKLTSGMTLGGLMKMKWDPEDCREAIQCIGIQDTENTEVYEGDILELRITDDLMDHKKNLFYNSNLGKRVGQETGLVSILCVLLTDKGRLGASYRIHFQYADGIEWYGERLVPKGCGFDASLPAYLCEKPSMRNRTFTE